MAQINIITTKEEQEKVIIALHKHVGQTVAMSLIARETSIKPNRVRYVIADLLDAGRIRRVPTKAFNEHYIRYTYEVVA